MEEIFAQECDGVYSLSTLENGDPLRFTTDRDLSLESDALHLLGLDHPLVEAYMRHYRRLPDDQIGVRVSCSDERSGVLSIWHVTTQGDHGETRKHLLTLAIDLDGQRIPSWEKQIDRVFQYDPAAQTDKRQTHLLTETLEPMIQRELIYRGLLAENRGFDARLVGWVEVT